MRYFHDDVIKWKHFPRYWPFVRGIHRSPVNSPHKGQWRGALMFTLICARINGWVNNREAGDLRRYRAHYDVIVMLMFPVFDIWYHYVSGENCWVFIAKCNGEKVSDSCHYLNIIGLGQLYNFCNLYFLARLTISHMIYFAIFSDTGWSKPYHFESA